jgi:hypothetical protein
MTGRYNPYTGNRPLKWQISVPKASFELFGRNRFWWVTCVLSYTLWDLGVSIAPPHPSALAIEWLAVLTTPESLSYCTTFPTLTVHMVEYMGYSTRLWGGEKPARAHKTNARIGAQGSAHLNLEPQAQNVRLAGGTGYHMHQEGPLAVCGGGGRCVDIFAGGMVQRGCLEGGRGSRIEDEAQGGGNRPTLLTGWLRWAQGRSRTP